jgi:hypothetical protein
MIGANPYTSFVQKWVRQPTGLEKGFPMKKIISTYWPIAMIVPVALVGFCHTMQPHNANSAPHMHSAANVSAEFARALSLGLVETDTRAPGYGPISGSATSAVSQTL